MQVDDELIYTKLDRAFCSPTWIDKLPDYALIAQTKITFDHTPLLLQASPYAKKRSPFNFEAIWLIHPQLEEKIQEWWNIDTQGTKMFQL